MTAVQVIQKSEIKYVNHTSIKKCVQMHGERATIAAVKEELNQMIDKKVWKPVYKDEINDKKKLIPSHMNMNI